METERQRGRFSNDYDPLPPHSVEGEQGVLGCCLLDRAALRTARERIHKAEVFYELRHQKLWSAMVNLDEKGPWDVIVLVQLLRDWEVLEQCGDVAYLSALQGIVASAAAVTMYVDMVWEKYLLRELSQAGRAGAIEAETTRDPVRVLEGMKEKLASVEQQSARADTTPKFLKHPADFQEGFFGKFFNEGGMEAPGKELPIGFPMKVRLQEVTLVSGDDGAGKSTLLAYCLLHLAAGLPPEERVMLISLEEPAWVSLWRLAAQLLGRKYLPDTDEGRSLAAAALGWLNKRFIIYDFTGIADWRDILLSLRFGAEKMKMKIALLDSVMRIGIGDDDYREQGFAASAFAQAAMEGKFHLFLVIHENKGDAKGKGKVRGSKLWTANVNNIWRVELNQDKGEKMGRKRAELENEKWQKEPDQKVIKELTEEIGGLSRLWDTRLVLQKQRYPGTRQNGSKVIWFNDDCFQFRDHIEDGAVNWLDRWKQAKPARTGGK